VLSDIVAEVRASRSISADHVKRLKQAIDGKPDRHQLSLLLLVDGYAERADPSWQALLAWVVEAAGLQGTGDLPAAA
jgi:hypothetical protein